MDLELTIAVMVPFTLAVVAFCISHQLSKAKREKRQRGYKREETHIDVANVPELKPTWKDAR